MAEIPITVAGNVATSIQGKLTAAGRVASFRLASNVRRFDRARGAWYDAETNYFTVTCWRQLADNVLSSLAKGEPVLVSGRVHVRQWKSEEREGTTVEIEASAVGHDLSRGTSAFRRKEPEAAETSFDSSQLEELHRMVEAEDGSEETSGGDTGAGESAGSGKADLGSDPSPRDAGSASVNGEVQAGAGGSSGKKAGAERAA
ncbi:MAG: single-stranded DNA-binding protein [Sporichthyaceae bacterium]|nr:single-stranded DNA-binding protein [Sporichthyaceae bacterium]